MADEGRPLPWEVIHDRERGDYFVRAANGRILWRYSTPSEDVALALVRAVNSEARLREALQEIARECDHCEPVARAALAASEG